MRQIGTIPTESEARRFADYLLTQSMPAKTMPEKDGWSVWIIHEDQRDRALDEYKGFLANPDDPKFLSAAPKASELRRREEAAERDYRRRVKSMNGRWAQTSMRARPVSTALIAISVGVFLLTDLNETNGPYIKDLLAGNGLNAFRGGEVWRLVTPIFVHFGPIHLLFNMMWIWSLGGLIESRKSAWFYLSLILVAAVVSDLAQAAWAGNNQSSGGMSGVVYALFGYAWIAGRLDLMSGMYLTQQTVVIMMGWLFLCMTGYLGPIGNAAHVGGLLVGIVFAFLRL